MNEKRVTQGRKEKGTGERNQTDEENAGGQGKGGRQGERYGDKNKEKASKLRIDPGERRGKKEHHLLRAYYVLQALQNRERRKREYGKQSP